MLQYNRFLILSFTLIGIVLLNGSEQKPPLELQEMEEGMLFLVSNCQKLREKQIQQTKTFVQAVEAIVKDVEARESLPQKKFEPILNGIRNLKGIEERKTLLHNKLILHMRQFKALEEDHFKEIDELDVERSRCMEALQKSVQNLRNQYEGQELAAKINITMLLLERALNPY
jgi:hypothetical protein